MSFAPPNLIPKREPTPEKLVFFPPRQPITPQASPCTFQPHLLASIRPSNLPASLPRVYTVYGNENFKNDTIAIFIQPFLKTPSLCGLLFMVNAEIERWSYFVKNTGFSSPEKKLLHLQVAQISEAREPSGISKYFLPYSVIARIFYSVQCYQPTTTHQSNTFAVANYFARLRNLPDFLRNLANEIVTRCRLGTADWLISYQNSLSVRNSSYNTYSSALKQLANDLGFSVEFFSEMLILQDSPISDPLIKNVILNKIANKRWGRSRAIGAICALKSMGKSHGSSRFQQPHWAQFETTVKLLGKPSVKVSTFSKSLTPEFAYMIYLAAVKFGPLKHQEVIRLIVLTCQRCGDYEFFQPEKVSLRSYADFDWYFSKTRTRTNIVQNTKMPFGRTDSFFDIKTCLENLLRLYEAKDVFLLSLKDASGKTLTHQAAFRLYASAVPKRFHSLPLTGLTMHTVKYMMGHILSKTKNLHPQVASHYLRHSNSDKDFQKAIYTLFPKFAGQWFSETSLNYVLHVSYLPAVGKELQRIWDDVETFVEQQGVARMLRLAQVDGNVAPGTPTAQ